jgi:DNA-binding beta-propeller fold protein YncE/tetratricopeptide (TPR) repeat protein/predicted Ser/Thr protein kinase
VQLGEYIIEERIGAGGMGQVYRAKQPSLDRMIALKVLPRSVAADQEAVDRFRREARNAARLVHSNIVQIYTVGEDRGVPYFAMEYVKGEDLEQRLRRGDSFTTKEAIGIVASTSMALACAEEHGIVHRDIKPGNVMIDSHGVVKVMDFGLAKAVKFFDTEITQAGFIVGTPTYMAPEQAEAMDIDHRTDIYSLGVVFYELLTGRPPFQSDDPATLIYMHVHRDPEPPTNLRHDVPEEVERVCLRCLAKNPDDRYQSATGLLAGLLKAEELLAGAEDEGTIVYDMRMANMLVSSAATKKPPAKPVEKVIEVGEAREVGEAPLAAPHRPRYWPLVVGSAVAALLLAGAVVALLLWGGPGTADDDTVGAGDGADVAGARSPVIPLSGLRNVLPPGGTVELAVAGEPPVVFERDALADHEVRPGTVKVTASRRCYRTVERTFAVRSDGINPVFSAEAFRLEPDADLAALIEQTERAIVAEDFVAAKKSLAEVRKADDESPMYKSLEEKLLDAQARRNEYWRQTLDEAEKLRANGDFDRAAFFLERMVEELPAAHELYAAAQNSLDSIRNMKKQIREDRVRIETLLREGRLQEARAALDGLVKDLGVPANRLGKLPESIATAEKLAHDADVALATGRYTVARARLKRLTDELTTESREHLDKLDEVTGIIERTRQAKQVIANIGEQISEEDFDGAKKSLRRLRDVDPGNPALAEIELSVRQGDAEHQVRSLLGHLGSGLKSGRGDVVASVIDPESRQFSEGARRSVGSLAGSGVKFVRTEYKLTKCDLRRLGPEEGGGERAACLVTWKFELEIPSVRRRMRGLQSLKMSLRKRPEGWRIAAVEPDSKLRSSVAAMSDGAGLGKGRRIQGRVSHVDGTVVTIDRGAEHGVKLKMLFTIYRDARVVRLPLLEDDSHAVVVVEEERIGEARVIEVRDTDCLASFLRRGPVGSEALTGQLGGEAGVPVAGMLAVRSPLSFVAGSPPEVLALRADRLSAPTGSSIKLTADCRNVDGLPCYFRFEADGGVVTPGRSPVPKAEWYAPHAQGEFTVKVTLVSSLEPRSREISLQSTGTFSASATGERRLVPARPIEIGAPFQAAKDLSFDEAGKAYILDETRSLLVLSSELEMESSGSAYRGKPLRIASLGGQVYVLDAATRSVRRHDLGADAFASPAGTSYGEYGTGNGKLRNPTAFALSPAGEVAVLDAGTMTVQVFADDGRFLQSVGASGGGVGGLQRPVGIVADAEGAYYVLDAGRRRVLVFRGGRHAGEFAVGSEKSEPVDIAYDSAGDRLLVLDGAKRTVTAYTTGGGRFSVEAVRPPPGGTEAKGREARIGELCVPGRIVCDGASRVYVICGDRSEYVDRFDLPHKLDGPATPSGRLSAVAPTTFARLAAGPEGRLGLLDTSTSQVWEIARAGWCVQSVGGRGIATPWSKAADIACDGRGDFYVLDPTLATVHRLGRAGERARFGKKGDPSRPENLIKPVAIAATPPGAAGVLAAGASEPMERVAVLLPERRFGVHVFTADGSPKVHFPADAASLRSSTAIAIGAGGEVHTGSSKLIESFNAGGGLLRRTEIEIDPAALAASSDGTLYALDVRRRMVVGVEPLRGRTVVKLQLPREIRYPAHLAVDGFGNVYVLDGRARKVFVWRSVAGPAE